MASCSCLRGDDDEPARRQPEYLRDDVVGCVGICSARDGGDRDLDGTPSPILNLGADYVESGVKMSLARSPGGGHYDLFEGNVGLYPNHDFAGSGNFSALKFEMADGSPFDLASLDLETAPLSVRDGVVLSVDDRFDLSNGFSLTVPADSGGGLALS